MQHLLLYAKARNAILVGEKKTSKKESTAEEHLKHIELFQEFSSPITGCHLHIMPLRRIDLKQKEIVFHRFINPPQKALLEMKLQSPESTSRATLTLTPPPIWQMPGLLQTPN